MFLFGVEFIFQFRLDSFPEKRFLARGCKKMTSNINLCAFKSTNIVFAVSVGTQMIPAFANGCIRDFFISSYCFLGLMKSK